MSTRLASHSAPATVAADGWSTMNLTHVLAQLPDQVSLEVEAGLEELHELQVLARAYALEGRVSFQEATLGSIAWRFRGADQGAPSWATDGSHGGPPSSIAEMVESLWPGEAEPSSTAPHDHVLRGQRVAIVTNFPAHYRLPLFTTLSRRLSDVDASLCVFFLGAQASGRPWHTSTQPLDFDHDFVKSVEVPDWVPLSSELDRSRATHFPRDLRPRLRAFDPTMLIVGSYSFSGIQACMYARNRIPLGIWSGEIPSTALQRAHPALRAVQRRWLVHQADFGIAYGTLAERYLRSLSPRLPVVLGRNTSVRKVTDRPQGSERRDTLELVTVADLSVPGKGVETLTGALQLLPDAPYRLTVIGGRPTEGPLVDAAKRDSRIRFLGAVPQKDVWAAYAQSDVFLFPSRVDVFGLSPVEAMSTGMAVVLSQLPGATADLAVPDRNCLVAEAADPRSWAEAIKRLGDDPELRSSLGEAARATIGRRWTIPHAVEGMVAGLRLGVLSSPATRSALHRNSRKRRSRL